MVVHALLDLPLALPPEAEARQNGLETFTDGLPEYLSRCKWRPLLSFLDVIDSKIAGQTYEGGISGSPGSEAHGAYAFCALACLCLLGRPEVVVPSVSSKDDFSSAFSWKHDPNFASDGQGSDIGVFTENDRLVPFHPIFVIPHKSAEDIRVWFENQSFDL
ncbi:CAAX farnesyltransferase (FTase) subunit beta [Aspergillus fumigatus]